jgi:hypothetical protein
MATFLARLHNIEKRRVMLNQWRLMGRIHECSDEELMRALAPDCHPVPLASLTNNQLLRIYNGEPLSSVLAPEPQ